MSLFDVLDTPYSELVIGLVAPVGTESAIVRDELHDSLKAFGYKPVEIQVSKFLREIEHGVELKEVPEDERLRSYMDAGDEVRKIIGSGDALALWTVAEIARLRKEDPEVHKKAFIVRSLKHPKEVQTFRRVYGEGFCLIGIYVPQEQRIDYLVRNKGIDEDKAKSLIKRDYDEEEIDVPAHIAQQTREAFHLADAFVSIEGKDEARKEVRRIVDLLFGRPSITPTVDEFAMFQAFTSALRSADLSRQVGAVILSVDNDLIGIGANDVPSFGGGLYWPGDNDQRDFVWGIDSNAKRRDQILTDIAAVFEKLSEENSKNEPKKESLTMTDVGDESLKDEEVAVPNPELVARIKKGLKKSILLDITEFGRPVHAEMEAILSCARTGTSTKGGTLYTTTFPCHNCAKHIVAAGIKRVVYVEPYPKSKAGELHDDSIEIDGDGCGDKLSFVPFVGIGPRKFFDLFSMGLSSGYALQRKKKGSSEAFEWKRETAKVRTPMLRGSYLEREAAVQDVIKQLVEGDGDENKTTT